MKEKREIMEILNRSPLVGKVNLALMLAASLGVTYQEAVTLINTYVA